MEINYLDPKSLIIYQSDFLNQENYPLLKKWLEIQNFESGSTVSGNRIDREQIWFQKDKKYFCPLRKRKHSRWESKQYDELLIKIQESVQKSIDHNVSKYSLFNQTNIDSCLVNKYPNGEYFIPPHSDSSLSFGERPVIIGLSIGETRKIVFRLKQKNQIKSDFSNNPIVLEKELKDNSLFIMTGDSQLNYTHEIIKEENKGIRYSLTFREMII